MNPMDDVDMNAGGFDAMADSSGAKGSTEKKKFKDKSILPVTIKQINKASREQGIISIDNTTPEMVKLFAIIDRCEEMATSVDYFLSDGTGTISAKRWKEKDIKDLQDDKCIEGAFVQVVGTLKEYNDTLSLQIFTMSEVMDYNALTHHILECILTHNLNTKGPIPGSTAAKLAGGNGGSAYNMGMGGNSMMAQSPGMGGNQRARNESGVEESLLRAIKDTCRSEEGTTVDLTLQYMVRTLQLTITREKVASMVENLTNDGVLYGTIDEMHFKSCED